MKKSNGIWPLKRWRIYVDLRYLLLVIILSMAGCRVFLSQLAEGIAYGLLLATPQITGTWEGVVCVVDVIDENNNSHQVVGIKLLKNEHIDSSVSGIKYENSEEMTNQEALDFLLKLSNNNLKPILVNPENTVIPVDQSKNIGKQVRVKGLLKLSEKDLFMPDVTLRITGLSECERYPENDREGRKEQFRCVGFVLIGTVELIE